MLCGMSSSTSHFDGTLKVKLQRTKGKIFYQLLYIHFNSGFLPIPIPDPMPVLSFFPKFKICVHHCVELMGIIFMQDNLTVVLKTETVNHCDLMKVTDSRNTDFYNDTDCI